MNRVELEYLIHRICITINNDHTAQQVIRELEYDLYTSNRWAQYGCANPTQPNHKRRPPRQRIFEQISKLDIPLADEFRTLLESKKSLRFKIDLHQLLWLSLLEEIFLDGTDYSVHIQALYDTLTPPPPPAAVYCKDDLTYEEQAWLANCTHYHDGTTEYTVDRIDIPKAEDKYLLILGEPNLQISEGFAQDPHIILKEVDLRQQIMDDMRPAIAEHITQIENDMIQEITMTKPVEVKTFIMGDNKDDITQDRAVDLLERVIKKITDLKNSASSDTKYVMDQISDLRKAEVMLTAILNA